MPLESWLSFLFQPRRRPIRSARKAPHRARLALEALEDRLAPATLGTYSAVEGPALGNDAVVLADTAAWTATSNAPFLHVTTGSASGSGNALIQYSFDANSGATRSGTLTIAGLTLTVTQAGSTYVAANPQTTLVSTGLSVPFGVAVDAAGNVYIADTFNNAIKTLTRAFVPGGPVSEGSAAGPDQLLPVLPTSQSLTGPFAPSSDQSWLTLGTVSTSVVPFSFTANTTAALRRANVTVLGQQITVTQAGPLTLGAHSALEGPESGNDSVVLADFDAAWTATSNAPFLHVTAGSASGSGNALIQYSFDANSGATRSGTLTIAGQTLTVTQAGSTYVAANPRTTLVFGLNGPSSVAVDAAGNVYIADSFNSAIEEWNATTQQVTTLVSTGLSSAAGVAVDAAGNVYIADTGHNAIEEWKATTQQVTTLVSSGLNGPSSVAVDAAGNVYIADTYNNAIEEWNATTQQLSILVSTGLNTPYGVAVDAAGNVYIADTYNNAIEEWNATTQQVTTLVSTGLSHPYGVAVDAAGNVFIADRDNNAIKKWTAATQQVSPLVSKGLTSPAGVAVDAAGNVFFSDFNKNTIEEWHTTTQQVSTLVSTGLKRPTGVAVDAAGNVFIADRDNNAIKEWNATTQQVSSLVSTGLSAPEGVAVDAAGNVYIADTGNSAIEEWNATTQQVSPLASPGLTFPRPFSPQGVAVDAAGNVYFSDSDSLLKEWKATTQRVSTLASGLKGPAGVAVDAAGNVYIADTDHSAIKTLTRAFVPGGAVSEGAAAGSDHLLPVLPTSQSLTGPFAPSSDQTWLTLGASANGAVNFSFTANTGTARTAHIIVLGQSITVTQASGSSSPIAPSLIWSNPADITYDTALGATQLNATANVAGTFTYMPASGTVLNAGPSQALSVLFTPTDTVNYTTAAMTVTINVLQAATTTTVVDAGGTYDGTTQFVATPTVSGAGTITGSATLAYFNTATSTDLGSTAPINAGHYTVTATYAGDANHIGSSGTATFDVLKATSTTTATGTSFVYDGTTHTGGSAVVSGVGIGITQTAVLSYSGDQVNAGSYTVTATYAGDATHLGSSDSATIFITKAASTTTTVGAAPFTYDGTAHNGGSGTVTGAGGLSTSATSLTYTGDQINAGTYSLTAHYAGDANHTASDGAAVAITIKKASSTTTATGGTFTYDGTAHAGSGSVNVSGGVVTLRYVGSNGTTYSSATAPTNAGTYTVVATYAGDGNHNGSSDSATIFITKAASTTTTVGAAPFTYDGTAHAGGSGTVTGAGTVAGSVTLTYSGDRVNTGTYSLTAHYAGDANHTASDGAAVAITIKKASSTTTATGGTFTYDGTAHAGSGSVNVSGGVVTLRYVGSNGTTYSSATAPTNAGTYTVVATYAGDGNHNGSTASAALTIKAKRLQARAGSPRAINLGSNGSIVLHVAVGAGQFYGTATVASLFKGVTFTIKIRRADGSVTYGTLTSVAKVELVGRLTVALPMTNTLRAELHKAYVNGGMVNFNMTATAKGGNYAIDADTLSRLFQ